MYNLNKSLISFFSQFINEDRLLLFEKILQLRTRYITVVLEDIYQTQNASAVTRSCECFGIQDIHIIENRNPFKLNVRVAHGADKWLNINRYNSESDNTFAALSNLKTNGYRIVATKPDPAGVLLNEFDLTAGKFALVFGSERPGISSRVEEMTDEFLYIPMVGFTESLNLSVSAATIIYQLTSKLRSSSILWHLSTTEKEELMLTWLRRHIKRSDLLEKRFMDDYLLK
jgi:tRNA (guanosine-2'-O-)-methyltransferase